MLLDTLVIKTLESRFNFRFSRTELETARLNGGHVGVKVGNRMRYFHIPSHPFRSLFTARAKQA